MSKTEKLSRLRSYEVVRSRNDDCSSLHYATVRLLKTPWLNTYMEQLKKLDVWEDTLIMSQTVVKTAKVAERYR